MDEFTVQIGMADKGRTFVRVIHKLSGKERVVVGIGGRSTQDVADWLQAEILEELKAFGDSPTRVT